MKCKQAQALYSIWICSRYDTDLDAYKKHRRGCLNCQVEMHHNNRRAQAQNVNSEAWHDDPEIHQDL